MVATCVSEDVPTEYSPSSTDAVMAAVGLSKNFGSTRVLHDVNFTVRKGEVVSVIGPSGSGKTTLLRCLALLEAPTEGEVRMDDVPIARQRSDATLRKAAKTVRPDIGMVFQHFNLWPHMTVLQNVIEAPTLVRGLDRKQAVEEAMQLLDKVGLSDKRDAHPSRLSGGQQQRVAIARALAMQPRIMLFDEATSALDPELRQEVLHVMRRLAEEGMTMLVVTHEMGFARNVSSRVVFMDAGRIVETAEPQAFFKDPGTDRARQFITQIQE